MCELANSTIQSHSLWKNFIDEPTKFFHSECDCIVLCANSQTSSLEMPKDLRNFRLVGFEIRSRILHCPSHHVQYATTVLLTLCLSLPHYYNTQILSRKSQNGTFADRWIHVNASKRLTCLLWIAPSDVVPAPIELVWIQPYNAGTRCHCLLSPILFARSRVPC